LKTRLPRYAISAQGNARMRVRPKSVAKDWYHCCGRRTWYHLCDAEAMRLLTGLTRRPMRTLVAAVATWPRHSLLWP